MRYFTAVADAIRTSLGPKGMDKMVGGVSTLYILTLWLLQFCTLFYVHKLFILSIYPHNVWNQVRHALCCRNSVHFPSDDNL